MSLIMVDDVASIFTQVYMAKVTSIHYFFPDFLHAVPFISLNIL